MFRYFNAIRDNTARLNIRLMAKVMVGQAKKGTLYADEFIKYSNKISMLSSDEIVAISELYKSYQEVMGDNRQNIAWENMLQRCVPSVFPSKEHVVAHLGAAARSGLVQIQPGWGGGTPITTPLLDEIASLVDFQDALRREKFAEQTDRRGDA